MKLSDFISTEFILTGAGAKTLEAGKNQLVELITSHTGYSSSEIIDAMTARESLGTTIIAPGIAFPHIREAFLKDFYVGYRLLSGRSGNQGRGRSDKVDYFLSGAGGEE